ncbi:hypothetical protein BV25DRAFT_1446369 [Artomyces pyxidatus]|uniref:Uncharacterized protein n=1 Tax=Artomyces pyxidatus TaxID=48021 RepID=A0ACB8SM88_9AGAM|nr:hypothetical protein BV25DRAFT_1446369 [Artomyces pyxidatus]
MVYLLRLHYPRGLAIQEHLFSGAAHNVFCFPAFISGFLEFVESEVHGDDGAQLQETIARLLDVLHFCGSGPHVVSNPACVRTRYIRNFAPPCMDVNAAIFPSSFCPNISALTYDTFAVLSISRLSLSADYSEPLRIASHRNTDLQELATPRHHTSSADHRNATAPKAALPRR